MGTTEFWAKKCFKTIFCILQCRVEIPKIAKTHAYLDLVSPIIYSPSSLHLTDSPFPTVRAYRTINSPSNPKDF